MVQKDVHLAGGSIGRDHVNVAVAIHIAAIHIDRLVAGRIELGTAKYSTGHAQPNRYIIRIRVRGDDIHAAIEVDIAGFHSKRRGGVGQGYAIGGTKLTP
jgi:hypothetical protein